MTALKRNLCAAVIAAAALFLACEKLPEDCGDKFIDDDQFCLKNVSYDKCDGRTYNPTGQFCDENSGKVVEKCGGKEYKPDIETCDKNTVVPKTDYKLAVGKAPEAGGDVSGGGSYAVGENVTVTAKAKGDYRFTKWTAEPEGALTGASLDSDSMTFKMPGRDLSLTANFTRTYKLTIGREPDEGGTVKAGNTTGQEITITDTAGTSITISATAADGYEFTNWTVTDGALPSGVNRNSASIEFNMPSGNLSLTANFKQLPKDHTLMVGKTSANGSTDPSGESKRTAGSTVKVTAEPNSGYEFKDWTVTDGALPSGVNLNSASIEFEMPDGNLALMANFQPEGTAPSKPDVPSGVTAEASSPTSITVSWSAVSGASGYIVYRGASESGPFTDIATINASTTTSHTNIGLTEGTTYHYSVSAFNAAGESSRSAIARATTPTSSGALPAPSGVTAAAFSGTSITVSWSAVSGASGYIVYSGASESGPFTDIVTITAPTITSFAHNNLTEGTTYYYRVSAVNSAGEESAPSSVVSATPAFSTTPPGTPVGVVATASSPTSVTVSWNQVAGATGYYVYRGLTASGDFTQLMAVSSPTVTTYTNAGLTPGTTYYYKVSAFNGVGEGAQSATVSVTPGGTTPTGNTFIDSRDNKTYKKVTIGAQTWMAENLNYNVSGSVCYGDSGGSCARYGRLYNWSTAKTACPVGWHLPSDAEWTTLTGYVGSNAGTKLKSPQYWNSFQGIPAGTDEFGFSALPGGYNGNDGFAGAGIFGDWWSATERNANDAWHRDLYYGNEYADKVYNPKTFRFSVRCLQD